MSTHEGASILRADRWWASYLKTGLLLLPSVVFFSVAVIFIFPKIKQMCADTNYDARYLFRPVDLVAENSWLILLGGTLFLVGLERWAPIWRRYRANFLAAMIFLVHSAVLLGLVTSLVVVGTVGPALSRSGPTRPGDLKISN
jgi:hypothetical protein